GFEDNPGNHTRLTSFLGRGSLSGLARDPADPSRLQLACGVCVHGGSPGWVQRLFDLAAALQVAEAHALATPLASALGARPALGGHPRSGPRPHPHSVLAVIGARVAPEGQAPSAFRGPGLAAALGAFAHGPFQAQGSDEGWTAELPFG